MTARATVNLMFHEVQHTTCWAKMPVDNHCIDPYRMNITSHTLNKIAVDLFLIHQEGKIFCQRVSTHYYHLRLTAKCDNWINENVLFEAQNHECCLGNCLV